MNKLSRIIPLLIVSLVLAGCHTTDNFHIFRNKDVYLKGRTAPPLMMPPGLSKAQFDPYYDVSRGPVAHQDVSLEPTGLYS